MLTWTNATPKAEGHVKVLEKRISGIQKSFGPEFLGIREKLQGTLMVFFP